MTAAAVFLALAALVVPSARGARLGLRRDLRHQRMLISWTVVTCSAATAFIAPVAVTVTAAIVVATVTVRRRRRAARMRRAAESAALEGALVILVGELRVGAHPVAAVEAAAAETTGPVATWLRAVAARARLGADVAEGLRAVAATSEVPAHWECLAACWHLAQSHGISIATLMHAAHRDVVERRRFDAQVEAGMAGARTTAAVLAGLPALGIGLGELMGAAPIPFLLSGGAGGWLLVVGSTLACCGLSWSDHITNRVTT